MEKAPHTVAVALVAAGALVASAAVLSLRDAPRLRVGTNVWIGYEPLHAWTAHGGSGGRLELVEYVSATQVLRAFENGEIDAAGVTLDEALRLAAVTHDVRLVSVADYSHGGDGVVARGRTQLAELRGARVGVERTALGALVLTRALERGGLTPGDVTIVPLTVNEHEAAWERGAVDAVVTFEPVLSRLRARGGRVLLSSVELHGEIVDVFVIRASMPGADALAAALRADWYAGRRWAAEQPGDFARVAAPRLGVDAGEVQHQLDSIEFPGEAEGDLAIDGGLAPVARTLARLMRERHLVEVGDEVVGELFPRVEAR